MAVNMRVGTRPRPSGSTDRWMRGAADGLSAMLAPAVAQARVGAGWTGGVLCARPHAPWSAVAPVHRPGSGARCCFAPGPPVAASADRGVGGCVAAVDGGDGRAHSPDAYTA